MGIIRRRTIHELESRTLYLFITTIRSLGGRGNEEASTLYFPVKRTFQGKKVEVEVEETFSNNNNRCYSEEGEQMKNHKEFNRITQLPLDSSETMAKKKNPEQIML